MPNAPRFREPSSGGSPSLAVVRTHPSRPGSVTGWCKQPGKSYYPDKTIPGKSYRLMINAARVLYVLLLGGYGFPKNIKPEVGNGLEIVFLGLSYPRKIFPRYDGFFSRNRRHRVITIDSFAVTIVISNNCNTNDSSSYGVRSISRGECILSPRMITSTFLSFFPDLNRTSGIPSQEKAYCMILLP